MTTDNPFISKIIDMAGFHFKAGRSAEAESCCRQVLDLDAANAEAGYLLSLVLVRNQRWCEAINLLGELAASFPEVPFIITDYRASFERSQREAEGVACFELLCTRHPEITQLSLNLGMLYSSCQQVSEAQGCFKRVLTREPDNTEALFLLGRLLIRAGKFVGAEGCLSVACELEQGRSDMLSAHGGVLKSLGRSDEAARNFRAAVAIKPDNLTLYGNYLANYLCAEQFTPEYVFARHSEWAKRHGREQCGKHPFHSNTPDPARRLRIAYVSADFHFHPVAFFIEPVLALHDGNAFDVYCYAHQTRPDCVTEQLMSLPVTWRQIGELDDPQVAAVILRDKIDILVDLGGHTALSRVLVFAGKPAPVQVTWLGYAHSTGLTSIDYRISDSIADPPGMTEHLHSEKLFRLEGSFICYNPPQDPPSVGSAPFLRQGFVTFGVFNNRAKWGPTMLGIWAEILLQVPGSRLMIKIPGIEHDEDRDNLVRQFVARGVDAARLCILAPLPTVQGHLQAVSESDIALDTFPYNGTTTTCESLFMGVPVVTLAGRSHVSRVGASILTQSGLPELVAATPESYVEIAVSLARQPERMLAYRKGLRSVMELSPFFDVHGFTKRLETGYREMWRIWCDVQKQKEL